jgi:hypothetical protein
VLGLCPASRGLASTWKSHMTSAETQYSFTTKGKRKVRPGTGNESPEGKYRYSSTLSLTSALDGDRWSTPRLRRYTAGKLTRYRRLGGPQTRSGRVRKISPPTGIRSSDRRVSTEIPRPKKFFGILRQVFFTKASEKEKYVIQEHTRSHFT